MSSRLYFTKLCLNERVYRYDFDMRTGKSETGLKACTYKVNIRPSGSGDESKSVWIEQPDEGTNWRVVEFRPVSEGLWLPADCNMFAETRLIRIC